MQSATKLLIQQPSVQVGADVEACTLAELSHVYRQLTRLIRKRYCRSTSGNALSPDEIQLETSLKLKAGKLLAAIGYPEGAAGQRSKEARKRFEHFRLKAIRPDLYGGPLTPEELEEEAALHVRRRILEDDPPVEQARNRFEQLKFRQFGFLLPMSGSEFDELLRLESLLDSYPLRVSNEDTARWLSSSTNYLSGTLPQPVAVIQDAQIDPEVLRYDLDTSISVLIADQAVGAPDVGLSLRNCGIADFVWSSSRDDALERLALYPYDILIVSLDTVWGHELTMLSQAQFKRTSVLSMTENDDLGENWNDPCLLRPAMTRSLGFNLRSLGLTTPRRLNQWTNRTAVLER
jgi:hypothetical protein